MQRSTAALAAALAVVATLGCKSTARIPEGNDGVLPTAVVSAEDLTEDIQDDIDTLGWTAATDKLSRLQATQAGLRSAVQTDPRDDSLPLAGYRVGLDSLAVRVGRRDRPGALVAANKLTRILLAVARRYALVVPIEVGFLDVAGRDVIYEGEAGRWSEAAASVLELRRMYTAVRDRVIARDPALDSRLQQTFNHLDFAIVAHDATRVRSLATTVLDDVDRIEPLF